MFADWISNGLGGQSMMLLKLAAARLIPATVSITADTGSENDRLCSTGERMTAPEFFEKYVKQFADRHGIEAIMIRAKNMPTVYDKVLASSKREDKSFESLQRDMYVPLFTADKSNGRLRQSCTDRWKLNAIKQEARRRGITLLRSAIGYHWLEAHRIKAKYLKQDGAWGIFRVLTKRDGLLSEIKWLETYYPLVDLKMSRHDCRKELDSAGIPYLVTTECDCCPHQDYYRWSLHTPEVIDDLARTEAGFSGKLFFTSRRIPLKKAIEEMRLEEQDKARQGEFLDFGCDSGGLCGI